MRAGGARHAGRPFHRLARIPPETLRTTRSYSLMASMLLLESAGRMVCAREYSTNTPLHTMGRQVRVSPVSESVAQSYSALACHEIRGPTTPYLVHASVVCHPLLDSDTPRVRRSSLLITAWGPRVAVLAGSGPSTMGSSPMITA